MKINKTILALIVISILGTFVVFPYLPLQIPSHFGINGGVDAWSSKYFVFLTMLFPIVIYLLLYLIPKIDPRRKSYEKHQKAYTVFVNTFLVFIVVMHWMTIGYALQFPINVPKIMSICLGVLFIILGNYMSQIRTNYTFGIKTPWTLEDPEVWTKTHRLGAYLFIGLGFLSILSIFISPTYAFYSLLIGILIVVLVPSLYSYLLYRKKHQG